MGHSKVLHFVLDQCQFGTRWLEGHAIGHFSAGGFAQVGEALSCARGSLQSFG